MGLTCAHPNNKTNKCSVREVTSGVYNPSHLLSLSHENQRNAMQGNLRILFSKSKTCEEEALDCDAAIFSIQKIPNSRISL